MTKKRKKKRKRRKSQKKKTTFQKKCRFLTEWKRELHFTVSRSWANWMDLYYSSKAVMMPSRETRYNSLSFWAKLIILNLSGCTNGLYRRWVPTLEHQLLPETSCDILLRLARLLSNVSFFPSIFLLLLGNLALFWPVVKGEYYKKEPT